MKIDFDDLIRQGKYIKELQKIEENEAYASLRAIELIKENEKLKQEIEHNRTLIEHNRTLIEHN